MKKLIALLLALVLCTAMACPVFAVEGETSDGAETEFVQSEEADPTPGDDDDNANGPGDDNGNGPADEEDNGLGVPETGDQSRENTALLAGLMGVSFVGIVAVSTLTAPRGAALAHKLPIPKLKKIFACFLYCVATKMLLDVL